MSFADLGLSPRVTSNAMAASFNCLPVFASDLSMLVASSMARSGFD